MMEIAQNGAQAPLSASSWLFFLLLLQLSHAGAVKVPREVVFDFSPLVPSALGRQPRDVFRLLDLAFGADSASLSAAPLQVHPLLHHRRHRHQNQLRLDFPSEAALELFAWHVSLCVRSTPADEWVVKQTLTEHPQETAMLAAVMRV